MVKVTPAVAAAEAASLTAAAGRVIWVIFAIFSPHERADEARPRLSQAPPGGLGPPIPAHLLRSRLLLARSLTHCVFP